MAKIQLGTEDGSTLSDPPSGDYWFFNDSNNSNQYTRRDSSGTGDSGKEQDGVCLQPPMDGRNGRAATGFRS